MKRILILLTFLLSINAYGQLSTINLGTGPGAGNGDPLRTAFSKTNGAISLINAVRLYNLNYQELMILDGALITTTELNHLVGTNNPIQTQLNGKVNVADTSTMLNKYSRKTAFNNPHFTGLATINTDTLATQAWSRSLIGTGGAGITYPGAGIAVSTGTGWTTSITNNSTNWNTAYSWGNHASAGYYVGTSSTIRGLFSSTATGLTYTNSTGVFSLTSGYEIPTTTQTSNWNTAYGWGNHASAGYATTTVTNGLDSRLDAVEIILADSTTLDYEINSQSSNYTLALSDNHKIVTMNSSSATNLTVPPNSSVAFPVGASITICCIGSGKTTVVAGSGVTILSKGSLLGITVLGDATLIKLGTNTWKLIGSLE